MSRFIKKRQKEEKNIIFNTNADKYVETVVLDCIAKYDFNREMYALTITKNKNNYRRAYNKANSNFANFTQRQYDYNKLEAQLLGWDDSDDDYEIATIEPAVVCTTANFTQRQYDCDKLEEQLLGWS